MHSSRMLPPAHWPYLVVSAGGCVPWTPPPPAKHAPSVMHAPIPCHTCPPMHIPLPHMLPPAMHTPSPTAMHAPCHAHPPLWTDRHLWKHNLRKLRLRAVKIPEEQNAKSGGSEVILLSRIREPRANSANGTPVCPMSFEESSKNPIIFSSFVF